MDESNGVEELCAELGRFLLAANALEHEVFDLFEVVSGRSRSDVVQEFGDRTLGNLINLLLREFRARINDEGLLGRLARIEPPLRSALHKRNEFVHAAWFFDDERSPPVRHRRPGTRELEEFQRMHPGEMFGVTHSLWQVTDDLRFLRDETLEFLGRDPAWSIVRPGA